MPPQPLPGLTVGLAPRSPAAPQVLPAWGPPLTAASRRAAKPNTPLPRRSSGPSPTPSTPWCPQGWQCRRAGSAGSPPLPARETHRQRPAPEGRPLLGEAPLKASWQGAGFRRREGGQRVPTSAIPPGKGKRGAEGSRRQEGGGQRVVSGAAVMAGRHAAHLAAGACRRGRRRGRPRRRGRN